MNPLSVVVTTRNRVVILRRCLESLFATVDPALLAEIVVVDDASGDDTGLFLDGLATAGRIRQVRHGRCMGPSVARNRGIAAATGEFVLITGDDVYFAPGAIAGLVSHALSHDMSRASVIGNIAPWPEGVTPFVHWSSHGGSQFAHERIRREDWLDAGHLYFYTTSILTPRALLLAFPFDESFPYARYEDRELGYRLRRVIGHRVHYLESARCFHEHPVRFRDWLLGFDRFVWSALHLSRLYPGDGYLRQELGITKAATAVHVDVREVLAAVGLLNGGHGGYFAASEGERARLGGAFRVVQEFFRTMYCRRRLGLPELRDRWLGRGEGEVAEEVLGRLDEAL